MLKSVERQNTLSKDYKIDISTHADGRFASALKKATRLKLCNVAIRLNGTKGATVPISLTDKTKLTSALVFESGATDSFTTRHRHLGPLTSCTVIVERKARRSARWLLDAITVTDLRDDIAYEFQFDKTLYAGQSQSAPAVAQVEYSITVTFSKQPGAGTKQDILMRLLQTSQPRQTRILVLPAPEGEGGAGGFLPGAVEEYRLRASPLDCIDTVAVWHSGHKTSDNCLVAKVRGKDASSSSPFASTPTTPHGG